MAVCAIHGEERVKSRCKRCRADYMRDYHARRMRDDPDYAERVRETWRKWGEANPEKRKRSNFLFRLRSRGLTEQSFAKLLAAQQERCAICGKSGRLVIDHCHDTHVVRGLLCNKCNLGIGLIESPESLRAAYSYLKNPPYANL